MRKYLLAAVAAIGVAGGAQAQVTPYLGEIDTFAFNFCPVGWLPTNGALVPVTQYNALFLVLGTMYGGDGVNNFGLPNTKIARTKTAVNLTQCIAYSGVFPSRN